VKRKGKQKRDVNSGNLSSLLLLEGPRGVSALSFYCCHFPSYPISSSFLLFQLLFQLNTYLRQYFIFTINTLAILNYVIINVHKNIFLYALIMF